MRRAICLLIVFVLLASCWCANAWTRRVESDYLEPADNTAIGLEIADVIQVNFFWHPYDDHEIVEVTIDMPMPENLCAVILTNGVYIAQGFWESADDQALHIFFYKDDLEPFIESEVAYLVFLRFKDGLYFKIY